MTAPDRTARPSIARHRRFVAAIVIDSIGTGVFVPVSMLYFLASTSLTLVQVGAALTTAGLLALPVGPLAGGLVDRYGARPVLQAANLAQALASPGISSWARHGRSSPVPG